VLQAVHIELIGICVPLHDDTHCPISIYKAVFIQVIQYVDVEHCKHGGRHAKHDCDVVSAYVLFGHKIEHVPLNK
jgi:hypothetical protein